MKLSPVVAGVWRAHQWGLDAAGLQRLADEVGRIVKLDDVKKRLDDMGTVPVGNGPAEFQAFLDAETGKWAQVIRRARVTMD